MPREMCNHGGIISDRGATISEGLCWMDKEHAIPDLEVPGEPMWNFVRRNP